MPKQTTLYDPKHGWILVRAPNAFYKGAGCANTSFNHRYLAFMETKSNLSFSIPHTLHLIDLKTLKNIKKIDLSPIPIQWKDRWKSAHVTVDNTTALTAEALQQEGYTYNRLNNTCDNIILGMTINQKGKKIAIADQTGIMIVDTDTNELQKIPLNLSSYRDSGEEYTMGFNRLGSELLYKNPATDCFHSFAIKGMNETNLLTAFFNNRGVCKKLQSAVNE